MDNGLTATCQDDNTTHAHNPSHAHSYTPNVQICMGWGIKERNIMLRSGPNVASKGHVKCLGTNRARYRVHIVACDEDVVWPCLGVFWVSGTVCLWFSCPFLMRDGLETVETGFSLRS